MRVLVVKTSSLGDLLHTLPALSDAQSVNPDLRFDWLAERAYAEIPRWHPAVKRVIECDLRGWRQHLGRTVFGGDWSRFRTELRRENYDRVIDAQGLLKSAWLASNAHGPLAGPDRRSAREPLAAHFYQYRHALPAHDVAHAIDRMRRLFAAALGYRLPQSAPRAGLERAQFAVPLPASASSQERPYVVLLHGTSWPGKRWPLTSWSLLAAWLRVRGLRVVLPWGNATERADAETVAAAGSGIVLPKQSLTELAAWLAHAQASVGVDTGLAHLAAALGTPQVTLYGPTLPQLTGAIGERQIWLRSDESTTIDRARATTVSVERVQSALLELLDRPINRSP